MELKNLTVRDRLGVAFGGLALIVLLVAVVSMHALSNSNARFVSYVQGVNASALMAEKVRTAVDQRAIAARNLVLVNTAADTAVEKAAVMRAHEEVQAGLTRLAKMFDDPADVDIRGRDLVAEMNRVEGAYGPVALAIVQLALDGKREQAIVKMNEECRPLLAKLSDAASAYSSYTVSREESLVHQATEIYASQRMEMFAACIFAFGSALLAGFLIERGLTRSLGAEPGELASVARRVAGGDLAPMRREQAAREGSVMASLQAMQQSLAMIVSQVRTASDSIATGSAQIATGNSDLSQRTEEQASALQQTAATMDELGVTVHRNAESSKNASRLALNASTVAAKGGVVVAEVVEQMKGINQSSGQIADIIGVIDGIAFQTNILALNAAVEAARAGEQGRGFAVVAAEVRSLAQRSAEAAKQIKTLITESVRQVEDGATLVDRAGHTMSEVVDAIRMVNEIVAQISAASVEQSAGVNQIGQAVSQMDRVTQQNAALVEESAAAAESLKQQALQLVGTMSTFSLDKASPASARA